MDGETRVIHPLTGIAPLPQFELWSVSPTQVSVERDIECEVRPMAVLANNQPLEFNITSSIDEYINLSETYLYIKAQVNLTKSDNSKITASDWGHVTPAQYFMHSIFSQIDVKIGDKEVTVAPQTYPYRAYLEALLGYSDNAKKTVLEPAMWKGGKMRQTVIEPKDKTASDLSKGKVFEMMGRLHTDLTFQEKNILGGSEVKIRLIPGNPKFYFTVAGAAGGVSILPEIDFKEVTLYVHKAKAYPSLVASHAAALADYPARYPVTRSEVRTQSVPVGQIDFILENVIRGQMPRRMFIALQKTKAFNGDFGNDPFMFTNANLEYLCAYIDGQQYPTRAYMPSFENRFSTREYMELYIALNQNRTDTYATITRDEFHDSPIFALNFAPDLSSGPGSSGHVNLIAHGSLRLHMRFKSALTEAHNVIMYCEFDNMIQIDGNRNVQTNYN